MPAPAEDFPLWYEGSRATCGTEDIRPNSVRYRVLEILFRERRPLGAYELMRILSRDLARRIAPPSVYRALNALVNAGMIARIESLNAYVLRAFPGIGPAPIFCICHVCGSAREMEDAAVERRLLRDARKSGFAVSRPVIELEGTCRECRDDRKFTAAF